MASDNNAVSILNQPMWAVLVADLGDIFNSDDGPIYVQAAPDTWYTVGEDTYITEAEFQDMREDNPDWTWTIFNGRPNG